MRRELLLGPLLIVEKIGRRAGTLRRRVRLSRTPASSLCEEHIGSLSLIDLVARGPKPNVVYDIGAYVGTWTLLAKTLLPRATIHAFEPLPVHWDEFERNVSGLGGVILQRTGLGARRHTAGIHVTNRSDASSVLQLTDSVIETYGLTETKTISVNIDTVDSMISEKHLPPPDLIKLDVQGYECEVLKGAHNALETCSWIICEVSFEEYYAGQPLFHEVARHLHDRGYQVFAFSHATPLGARLTQTDVLFRKGR